MLAEDTDGPSVQKFNRITFDKVLDVVKTYECTKNEVKDTHLDVMTSIYKRDTLKMYLHVRNEHSG